MRQPQNGKTSKENISITIDKKKHAKKSKRPANYGNTGVTMENLECINDALHFHQAYGVRGTWRLVPKDSCEVYKDQRRRQNKSRRYRSKSTRRVNKPQGRKRTSRRKSLKRDRSVSDTDSRHSREKSTRSQKKGQGPTKRGSRQVRSPESLSSYESMASYATSNSDSSTSSAHSDANP